MRLVVFDFDKTLTIIDSGLLSSLSLVFYSPRFLLQYLRLYFSFSHERNFNFKKKLAEYHAQNGISNWFLRVNTKPRIWAFLRACLENHNSKVVIISGSSKSIITNYLDVYEIPHSEVSVLDYRDLYDNDPVLQKSKVKVIARLVESSNYCSIVHLNDNGAELNAVRCGINICITNLLVT